VSILIKGMEMPKDGVYWCEIGVADDIAMITIHGEDRKSFPLVPAPEPHGRLGDLDELYNHLNEWYLTHEHGFSETEKIYIRAMLSGVKDSPTIISASEEAE